MRDTSPRPRLRAAANSNVFRTPSLSRRAFVGGAVLIGFTAWVSLLGSLSGPPKSAAASSDETSARDAAPNGTKPAPTPIDRNDWKLVLVNPSHPIDPDYAFERSTTQNGFEVDERCLPDVERLLNACSAAGCNPFICSAFRTHEMQESLFERQVQSMMAKGLSPGDAQAKAATIVAAPGTSEHQVGLALDIVDFDDQNLTDAQADTPTQRWLIEHSWEYGFIFRYAADKTEITGVVYEPWHYRYVGLEAAETITKRGICLEEYLAQDGAIA